MPRSTSMAMLAKRFNRLIVQRFQPLSSNYSTMLHSPIQTQTNAHSSSEFLHKDARNITPSKIGENIPKKDKIRILVATLTELNDSKESIYSTLDSWVAFERNFPIGALKNVIIALEKEHQWHRVVQVIKWMLSKGQGTTRGTYGQLIQALDFDRRAEEAHLIWEKKLGFDLHSVPWKLCNLMISVYYRNNMHGDLVKLFKGLEGFDRKPPEKSIVQKVADAYELMGKIEEKERVMEKYKELFVEKGNGKFKKRKGESSAKKKLEENGEVGADGQ